jgi:tetratricopeptide (TPR) repeat protein
MKTTTARQIFLSYRRSDSGGYVRALYESLSNWFDHDLLFFDRDGIEEGDVFPEVIANALADARAVLVLIGPGWLHELNRRVDAGGVDFVRLEVSRSLERHASKHEISVLPVLLGGAAMPSAEQLDPRVRAELAQLCAMDSFMLVDGKHADWRQQLQRLRERLRIATGLVPSFRLPDNAKQPYRTAGLLSPHHVDAAGLVDQLQQRLEAGGDSGHGSCALLLLGMGGVGKTQLALAYCSAHRRRYAGVWWLRAETEATWQADAADACVAAGAPPSNTEGASIAFARWLDQQDAPWLIVYDNVEGPEALKAHLPRFGRHHVLVTSRNPHLGTLVAANRRFTLEAWNDMQAADFLHRRGAGGSQEQRIELARELGGLPLALEQVASYLDSTGVDLARYMALYRKSWAQILERRDAPGNERSVAAALTLSLDRLTPSARQLLRLLAQASPEAVPEHWIVDRLGDLPDPLSAAAGDEIAWHDIAGELRRYAFVERTTIASQGEPVFVLHRLTLAVLRSRFGSIDDLRAWVGLLHACQPPDAGSPLSWPQWESLAPHVVAVVERAALDETSAFAMTRGLAASVATYLELALGAHGPARKLKQSVLEVSERRLGSDNPSTIASMQNLAVTLFRQGDLKGARALLEEVVRARRRLHGEHDLETVGALGDLASVLAALRELANANTLQQQVLAAYRAGLGADHPRTLASMANLAVTLQKQGEFVAARGLQERVVDGYRWEFGADHPKTCVAISNLGLTLYRHGELAEARLLQQEAFDAFMRILGADHPDTLAAMNNLAATLGKQQDLAGAKALQEQVLDANRRTLGDEHPRTLTAMNNLGATLAGLGDLNGAMEIEWRVLDARRRVLGAGHPETLATMSNYAHTLRDVGMWDLAIEWIREASHRLDHAVGVEHPDAASTRATLERWVAERGERQAIAAASTVAAAVAHPPAGPSFRSEGDFN